MTNKHKSHCDELEDAVRGLLDAVFWLGGNFVESTSERTTIVPGGKFEEDYKRIVQPAIAAGFEVLRD